ncbi:MAG: hypothetical protein P4L40_06575 [Terracidiphilus sp.]|nr:hypothetical protein [Terracidiphilus sp.]
MITNQKPYKTTRSSTIYKEQPPGYGPEDLQIQTGTIIWVDCTPVPRELDEEQITAVCLTQDIRPGIWWMPLEVFKEVAYETEVRGRTKMPFRA